jgi:hypothetical protein
MWDLWWTKIFTENFGFPCQFSSHRLLHTHHHLSSGAGTIGQLVADVPSGLSSPHPKKLNTHPALVFWKRWVRVSAGTLTLLTEVFPSFSEFLQANGGIVPGQDRFLPNLFESTIRVIIAVVEPTESRYRQRQEAAQKKTRPRAHTIRPRDAD